MKNSDKLAINEIFYSLQGEGVYTGHPAIFIRLAGCIKPFCSFCDTPQSLSGGTSMSFAKILEELANYPTCRLLVITGGEPFMQWESGLSDFEQNVLNLGYNVQYETSGKVQLPPKSDSHYIVCSPKQTDGFQDDSWAFLESNLPCVDGYKFIWQDNTVQLKNFIERHNIKNSMVSIMPQGKTKQEQLENLPKVWNVCSENNWKLSARLHILAFDQRKGI